MSVTVSTVFKSERGEAPTNDLHLCASRSVSGRGRDRPDGGEEFRASKRQIGGRACRGVFFSGQLIQRGLVVVDAGTSKKEVPRLYRIAPYHWRLGIELERTTAWTGDGSKDTHNKLRKRWSLIGMAGGVSECSGMSDGRDTIL